MTDLIYTHISARLPGPDHHFLINQYGVMFHEMRASDLVQDRHGRQRRRRPSGNRRVNAAGFTIHSAIHMARHDLCASSTPTPPPAWPSPPRSTACCPSASTPSSSTATSAYHGYEGIALDLDERTAWSATSARTAP